MANWDSVSNYLRTNYKIAEEIAGDDGQIMGFRLLFDVGDLRSQLIYIWHETLGDQESWVKISSPFGQVGRADLPALLQRVGAMVCGAVAAVGDTLVLTHSAPLDNLDLNEFDRPFTLILHTADLLEQQFGSGDNF